MRGWILGGALLIFLAAVIFAHVPNARYGPWGYGYGYGMGPWMMGRYPMGPWAMGPGAFGYGYGPGVIGGYGGAGNLSLSANDVTSTLNRWITLTGNSHIKVGNVVEKDADTITADILTTDKDGLVQRFAVDRHTGFFRPEGG